MLAGRKGKLRMKIDVIIPVYKPEKRFLELISRLEKQTLKPNRIIIMNTEEKYFEALLYGTDFAREHPNAEVHHLSKWEFNHGGTRNDGAARSTGDIFVCMTQDALPADNRLLEELTAALSAEEDIAVSYARQLPEKDSGEIEKYTRQFNYPEESCVKGKGQLPEMGIKTYFCSNVCAAYKKEVFRKLGGFERHVNFNEDMLFAAKAVRAGWKIAYCAGAKVYHCHNYTCAEQFHRNFDNGVSQAQHPEVFKGLPSESEGVKLVKQTAAHLCSIHKPWLVLRLFAESAAKYAGFFLGRRYKSLPAGVVRACAMNKDYWKQV